MFIVINFFTGCIPKVEPILKEEVNIKEDDLALAILFCNKKEGLYQEIGDLKKCVLDNNSYDLVEYYFDHCLPLGEKCIIYENNDLPVNNNSINIQKDEFIGKIYSLSPASKYDNYILLKINGEEVKYGIQSRVIEKRYDKKIQDLLKEYTNTNQEVIVKGYLVKNIDDVGGHRIIVESILKKE